MANIAGSHSSKNGLSSQWQKRVELTVAKMGGTGVIDTVTKMGGAHCGKNWWSSPWQKRVELTVAKMCGTCVIDTVTKMGGTHSGKNGWNWCYRHLDKNGLS